MKVFNLQGERTILFDAGVTPKGVVENMRRLGALGERGRDDRAQPRSLGPRRRDGGNREGARASEPSRAHPSRLLATPPDRASRARAAPSFRPRAAPRSRAPASRSSRSGEPSFLLDGSVLVTGEVDRTTQFETGFLGHEAHVDGSWEPDP